MLSFLKKSPLKSSLKTPLWRFLSTLFLAYLVASTTFLAAHTITHQVSDQTSYKIIKSTNSSPSKKSDHCDLCDLFGLQTQLLFVKLLTFIALAFYSKLIFSVNNCLKLSCLNSSRSVRAPPYFY